ncbi:Humj1 family protein [Striga asiatica]|uniref:Humj1 family protein n=1 Tax=Striga asiatica TaxID=4170 RepID=A0A5A7RC45_STRAF|nr:Humj1 family protein [Striga asiatica]
MAAPNMATITASLERSLQNCSLNHHHHHHHHPQSSTTTTTTAGGGGAEAAHGQNSPTNLSASPALELNSEASLPFNWEQCLDLKTGEIYYINWRTGMKVKEDPRTIDADELNDDCYYSEDDDDSSSSYDSQGSCSETSPSSSSPSRLQWCEVFDVLYGA